MYQRWIEALHHAGILPNMHVVYHGVEGTSGAAMTRRISVIKPALITAQYRFRLSLSLLAQPGHPTKSWW